MPVYLHVYHVSVNHFTILTEAYKFTYGIIMTGEDCT